MHPEHRKKLAGLVQRLTHEAIGRLITYALRNGIDPDEKVTAKATDDDAGLQVVVIVAPWKGPPRLYLNDLGQAALGNVGDAPPADPAEPPPQLPYRTLSEAEAFILAAMPRGAATPITEIAQATGYTVRYAEVRLGELYRDGLVFKGHGRTWLRT